MCWLYMRTFPCGSKVSENLEISHPEEDQVEFWGNPKGFSGDGMSYRIPEAPAQGVFELDRQSLFGVPVDGFYLRDRILQMREGGKLPW